MNIFSELLNAMFVEAGPGPGPTINYCSNVIYAVRQDVEIIFGPDNVAKWADIDNMQDEPYIANRICWSLLESQTYIDTRLNGGPYDVPFAGPPYPPAVSSNTARLAGVILYEARGVPDTGGAIGQGRTKSYSMPKHQLTYHRNLVEDWLNDVLSLKIQILGAMPYGMTPIAGV